MRTYPRALWPLALFCAFFLSASVARTETAPITGVHVVTLSGTPHERGVQHGKALRDEIGTLVASWKANLRESHGVDPDAFIAKFLEQTDFAPAIEKWTPGLMEEVRGIAEGAGVDFPTMFAFQLPDEIWANAGEIVGDKCTSIGVGAREDRPTVVAQNLDVPPWYHLHPTVLRIRYPDSTLEALVVTIPGLVGANGMNNRRLGVTVNTILQLKASRTGLPVAFVVRGILACETHPKALDFVRGIEHASGQNYIVGGPEEAPGFECSERVVARFSAPGKDYLTYHTNHPVVNGNHRASHLEQLEQAGRTVEQGLYQCPRFASLERRLGGDVRIDLPKIEETLRSRDPGVPINNPHTYVCTIMVLADPPSLHIAAGRPDRTPFEVLGF